MSVKVVRYIPVSKIKIIDGKKLIDLIVIKNNDLKTIKFLTRHLKGEKLDTVIIKGRQVRLEYIIHRAKKSRDSFLREELSVNIPS